MDSSSVPMHFLPPGGNQTRPGIDGKVTGSKAPLKRGLWFREENPGIACVKYTCAAERNFGWLDAGETSKFGFRSARTKAGNDYTSPGT